MLLAATSTAMQHGRSPASNLADIRSDHAAQADKAVAAHLAPTDTLSDDAAQPDGAVSTNIAAVSTRGVLQKTEASKRTSFAPDVTERPLDSDDAPVVAADSSADQTVAVANADTTAAVSHERAPPSRTSTKSSDKTPRQRTPLHTRADQGDTCGESDSARLQAKRTRHQEFVRCADATGIPSRVSRAIMRSPVTVTLADLVAFICQQGVVDVLTRLAELACLK